MAMTIVRANKTLAAIVKPYASARTIVSCVIDGATSGRDATPGPPR